MSRADHICLMATYNQWMNAKIYGATRCLSDDELSADRKAFFKSILGTLNHVAIGDTVWLKRFAKHPADHAALEPVRQLSDPESLDQLLFSTVPELSVHRERLDQIIVEWAHSITEPDLDHTLHYASMNGVVSDKNFYSLVMHFFNHQTHHRGQVTTLLSQAGIDIVDTDLVFLIPSQSCV